MNYFSEDAVVRLCLEKLSEIYLEKVLLKELRPVGGGSINQTARLSCTVGDFFLKWNQSGPADVFEKEASGLNEMRTANMVGVIIPEIIWYTNSEHSPCFLLLEYLPPAQSVKGFDEELGHGLAQLHRKTSARFGFKHRNYCGSSIQENNWTEKWNEFYSKFRIWPLVQQLKLCNRLTVDELVIYDKLIDKLPDLLSHQTFPSLIHGDLWAGNSINTLKGPALIDPACYYADREMELAMMKLFGGFSPVVWNAYQSEFPLPQGWEDRIRLYQLYHILNHYLMFGGSYGFQAVQIASGYIR